MSPRDIFAGRDVHLAIRVEWARFHGGLLDPLDCLAVKRGVVIVVYVTITIENNGKRLDVGVSHGGCWYPSWFRCRLLE